MALVGLAAVWLAEAALAQEKRIALVIGNSGYEYADMLPNPRNDAAAIAEVFERLDFEVELALDVDGRAMADALRNFGIRAESADVAVVFYAGHGIQVSGENYLLPTDARLLREWDLNYEAVPLSVIMGEVAQARKLGLVILDACRDNPLAEELRRRLGPIRSREVGTGLARMDNLPGDTMIAFSTRPGEVAVDGQGRHSPYTEALLRHLDEPGLELNLLFRRVRESVLQSTAHRQDPRTFDALGAEPFYFQPPRPNQRPQLAALEPLELLDDAGPTPLGIPAPTDPDDDPMTAQVMGLPRDGEVAVDGRPVLIGDVLAIRQLTAATFAPSGTVTGDAGSFDFLIKDDRGGTAIGRVPVRIEAARPPEIAMPDRLRLPAIPLNLDPPSDPRGDPLTITVTEVPEVGVVRSGEREIEAGDELSPEEVAALVLEPTAAGASGRLALKVTNSRGASATSALELSVPALQAQADSSAPAMPMAEPETAPAPVTVTRPAEPEAAPEPEPATETATAAAGPAPEPAPETTTAAEPAPAPDDAVAGRYRAVRTSNIRSGPSAGTERVTTVAEGSALRVTGKAPGRDWYAVVTPEGQEGYIHAGLVEPLPEPAVALRTEPQVEAEPEPEPAPAPEQKTASLGAGRTLAGALRDCEGCPPLVAIEGGSFVMGSNAGHRSERPAHRVQADGFALGKYEVTVGQWQDCVDAGGCEPQPDLEGLDPDLPAHDLSWSDAQDYVAWLRRLTGKAYRLPTEAEWEYAARAGARTRYWWGDEVGSGNANCQGCGGEWDRQLPAPVDAFPANPFGLHGMNGGVMEWVADCWFRDHEGAPADGRAREREPCLQRTLRGGAWRNDETYATSTSRLGYDFDVRYLVNGFRVARDLD